MKTQPTTNTPDQAASEREKFANKVCPKCNHKNYFVRLDSCPNCDEAYMTDDTKPESASEREKAMCPKCGSISGDDWTQCGGSCPMPISPHYKKPNDTKPESASERDEETAFLKQFVKDYSHPEAMKIWQDGFDAGRQSMREETKNKTEWGQLRSVIDRQEKTILELRAALEKIADPRKLGHSEPDYQTKYYCLIHLAEETLARTEVK